MNLQHPGSRFGAILIALITVLLALPMPSLAAWTGGIEGGTEISDSGTNTRLRLRATNNIRPVSHYVYAEWIRDDSSNNSYEVGYVPRYWFTDTVYSFADARFGVNRPLDIDASRYLVAGLGIEPVRTNRSSLYAEIGVGTQSFDFGSGLETSESIAVARALAIHRPIDDIQLSFELDASSGEDVVQADAEAGISLRVPTGNLRYSYRQQWLRIGDGETVSDGTSFFSYSFGF